MPHRDMRSRLAALTLLLDRGWETIALEGGLACTVTPEALARMSDDDLRAIVDVGTRLQAALAASSTTDIFAPAPADTMLTTT